MDAWNNLDRDIKSLKSISLFKKALLAFIRPKPFSVFDIHDPPGLKLLTRLRVNLSHLREHKFKYNFQDTPFPLCSCSLETESVMHFLLRCPLLAHCKRTLIDNLNNLINGSVSDHSEIYLVNILLYGSKEFSPAVNHSILKSTILFIQTSKRFDGPLL